MFGFVSGLLQWRAQREQQEVGEAMRRWREEYEAHPISLADVFRREQSYLQADMATKTRIGSMYQQNKTESAFHPRSLYSTDVMRAQIAGKDLNPDSLSAILGGLGELNNNLNQLRALSADVADTMTGAFPTEGEASNGGYDGANGLVAMALHALRQANKRVEQIAAEIQRVKYAL